MATTKPAAGKESDLARSVDLTDDDLIRMYQTVALARAVDERMWILNRAGRVPFVISGQGHEGAQVGIMAALRQGHDWMVPFYRSVAACLAFGMTPRDIMLAQFAKAVIGGEYEGFAKVIGNPETGDTLGVHIIGPHATDLIAETSLGMTLEAAAWEIGSATHPHPTLSEIVGEAAMAVDGRSINF